MVETIEEKESEVKIIIKNIFKNDLQIANLRHYQTNKIRKVIEKMTPGSKKTFNDEKLAKQFYRIARLSGRVTKWNKISKKRITIYLVN